MKRSNEPKIALCNTCLLYTSIGTRLVKLACRILPDSEEDQQDMQLKYLDFSIFDNDYHIGTSAIANTQLFNETQHMLNVANHNVKRAFELLDHYDEEKYIRLQKDEEYINYLNQQVINFTTAVTVSYTHLDVYKRQLVKMLPRQTNLLI